MQTGFTCANTCKTSRLLSCCFVPGRELSRFHWWEGKVILKIKKHSFISMSSDFLYSPQKYFMLCNQEAFLLEQASLGLVWDSKFLRVHYVLRGCTTFTHSMPDIKSRKMQSVESSKRESSNDPKWWDFSVKVDSTVFAKRILELKWHPGSESRGLLGERMAVFTIWVSHYYYQACTSKYPQR